MVDVGVVACVHDRNVSQTIIGACMYTCRSIYKQDGRCNAESKGWWEVVGHGEVINVVQMEVW